MMKKILVPIDFSAYAHNALKIALQIARKAEAQVYILHVVPSLNSVLLASAPEAQDSPIEQEFLDQAYQNASKTIQDLVQAESFPLDQTQILLRTGHISQEILTELDRSKIELVVMGTQGTKPLEEIFIGSTTEKIVRFAPCPVLAVRDHPENFITAKILFPTDLETFHAPAVAKLREFQRLFDAHLHLLYINSRFGFKNSEEIELKKNHFVLEAKLDNYTFEVISAQSEEGGILLTAKRLDVDMIALLTHQRKGLAHFFLGSTSEDVVNHADRPVLTLGNLIK